MSIPTDDTGPQQQQQLTFQDEKQPTIKPRRSPICVSFAERYQTAVVILTSSLAEKYCGVYCRTTCRNFGHSLLQRCYRRHRASLDVPFEWSMAHLSFFLYHQKTGIATRRLPRTAQNVSVVILKRRMVTDRPNTRYLVSVLRDI